MIYRLKKNFELLYDVLWEDVFLDKLDIDHIIPISTATTESDLFKLNHYTNLQLLYYKDNRFVKSDKLLWELDRSSSEFYLEFKEVLENDKSL